MGKVNDLILCFWAQKEAVILSLEIQSVHRIVLGKIEVVNLLCIFRIETLTVLSGFIRENFIESIAPG